jgi:hypothetical protein
MSFINWGHETPEQLQARKKMEDTLLFEQAAYSAAMAAAAAAGSSAPLSTYIVTIDTAWLYPIADIDYVLETTEINFVQEGNDLIFNTLGDLTDFYDEVFIKTSESQPVGNVGYSLGVGTLLLEKRKSLNLKLSTGEKVVTWRLFEQLTNQEDVLSPGNSPDGTIGYGSIYNDYDLNGIQDPTNASPPPAYSDPLRIIKYID